MIYAPFGISCRVDKMGKYFLLFFYRMVYPFVDFVQPEFEKGGNNAIQEFHCELA